VFVRFHLAPLQAVNNELLSLAVACEIKASDHSVIANIFVSTDGDCLKSFYLHK
jgi:hypothetical protein